MKARFIGDTDGDVETLGVVFPKGKAADVSPDVGARLKGNPFFEVKDEPVKTAGDEGDGGKK